jgi:hypothetical protein
MPLFGPITICRCAELCIVEPRSLLAVIHNDHTSWNALSIDVNVAQYTVYTNFTVRAHLMTLYRASFLNTGRPCDYSTTPLWISDPSFGTSAYGDRTKERHKQGLSLRRYVTRASATKIGTPTLHFFYLVKILTAGHSPADCRILLDYFFLACDKKDPD